MAHKKAYSLPGPETTKETRKRMLDTAKQLGLIPEKKRRGSR